jgi:hypothetical protein
MTVLVPLFAKALATTDTVPVAPGAHCTVTVLLPVDTTVAIVSGGLVGFATMNWPAYGAVNVKGAGDGATLNIPEAVKVTWPLGNVCASAVAGATVIEYNTRPASGPLELHDEITVARTVKSATNPKVRRSMNSSNSE